MSRMHIKTMAFATGMTILFAACVSVIDTGGKKHHQGLTEEDLGIRKETLYDEKKVKPAKGEYTHDPPGSSTKIERAFENSPPLIPHDITGMLPIAINGNVCLGCHMPDEAVQSRATAIPRSHLMKLAKGRDLHGNLDHERFDCMACHVPQVDGAIPVENTFKGGFKDQKSRTRSNLVDTLNEGVIAD